MPLILIGVYLTACRNTKESNNEYQQQLTTLSSLLEQYNDEADIITLGDFQSFPSFIYDNEPRNHVSRNNFSPHLKDFLQTNELEFVDVTSGNGPNITYNHISLGHKSYIDHIAVQKKSSLDIDSYGTLGNHELNTSDHLPLFFTINITPAEKYTHGVKF